MLKIFALLGGLTLFAPLSLAVEVGDTVLMNRSGRLIKVAKVMEIANGQGRLSFSSKSDNDSWGRDFLKIGEGILPYNPVQELESEYRGQKFLIKKGDQVIYYNQATAKVGVAEDITADGFIQLKFQDSTENIMYGNQFQSVEHIAPFKVIQKITISGITYSTGMNVLRRNPVSTLKATIKQITESGFVYVDFVDRTRQILHASYYDFFSTGYTSFLPSNILTEVSLKDGASKISIGDTVQIKYYEWVQTENKKKIERQFIGNYLVEVVELTDAGYARIKFENKQLQLKNHDQFFPLETEIVPFAKVSSYDVVKRERNRFAELLGRLPKVTILASYALGDSVFVTIGFSKYKATIKSLGAKGQILLGFDDPHISQTYSEKLFEISKTEIEKINPSGSSCGNTIGTANVTK